MFHVPTEVSRQSHKYRRTLLLNHVLKTKMMLPRNDEFIGGKETKTLILKIENKNCERLADVVF